MGAMLHEINIDSYYVVVNSERGSVTRETPAHKDDFDHVIIAIKLPDGIADSSLMATMAHPKLGKLLFFDPTDELTPFGQLSGALQANYGLLVAPDGGELVESPALPSAMNGIRRTAKLSLTPAGTLTGLLGDDACGRGLLGFDVGGHVHRELLRFSVRTGPSPRRRRQRPRGSGDPRRQRR